MENILLKCSDNEVLGVEESIALQFKYIKKKVEDVARGERLKKIVKNFKLPTHFAVNPISVPSVESKTLAKIIEYYKHRTVLMKLSYEEVLMKFSEEFLRDIDNEFLYDIFLATSSIGAMELYRLTKRKHDCMIRGDILLGNELGSKNVSRTLCKRISNSLLREIIAQTVEQLCPRAPLPLLWLVAVQIPPLPIQDNSVIDLLRHLKEGQAEIIERLQRIEASQEEIMATFNFVNRRKSMR